MQSGTVYLPLSQVRGKEWPQSASQIHLKMAECVVEISFQDESLLKFDEFKIRHCKSLQNNHK